jgi:hypothetical protein
MLLSALEEALEQITAIFSAMQNIAVDERVRLYKVVGIGRHVRHIVDHFNALRNRTQADNAAIVFEAQAAQRNVDSDKPSVVSIAMIDYNQRSRDSEVERDFELALSVLQSLSQWIANLDPASLQQVVQVRAEISCMHTENGEFQSTFAREILYLINHTIHHAAYTKLLLSREGLQLPAHIGVAPCTASYLRNKAA